MNQRNTHADVEKLDSEVAKRDQFDSDPTRRDVLRSGIAAMFTSMFGGGVLAGASSLASAQMAREPLDPPYLMTDLYGNLNVVGPANDLSRSGLYVFADGHRFSYDNGNGIRNFQSLETMRRNLIRLLVRCEYDLDEMARQMDHDIRDLALPFDSREVGMTGGWVYPNGDPHTGVDFARRPKGRHQYPDLTETKDFPVVAVADGTIVGWDGVKLLTLEHESPSGRLYRTAYNMLRDVGMTRNAIGAYEMGRFVARGEVIGIAHDAPYSASDNTRNVKHLHFAMFLSHEAPQGWQPNTDPIFDELTRLFGITLNAGMQESVREELEITRNNWLGNPIAWKTIEWFPADPFGVYSRSHSTQTDYGFVYEDLFNPVPKGIMPYAFADPTGDRIPYFAATTALRNDLPVQPLSLATMAAMLG